MPDIRERKIGTRSVRRSALIAPKTTAGMLCGQRSVPAFFVPRLAGGMRGIGKVTG